MISTIDKLGELIDWVDSLGIEENTLILFLSDNGGGNGQRIYYHNVRFFKSNGQFLGMKRDLLEGGIRVPLIMQWKGAIKPGPYPEIIKEMEEIIQKEHQASPFWPLKGED